MSAQATQRRLSAILAADVVGYSKLMADDEAGTLAALREHRTSLFDPETQKRGGRIVKLMGDGTLVEFPSVVDAVECALAIQQALATDDGPIKLRIGINLGDVIIDGDDIYGDGVNIAARLEALAEPGGICIASIVHESLGNRIDADFVDAGEHAVKNIARPIRVFQWPCINQAPDISVSPAADRPSIAVLPFDNMSDDPEQEYFADGMCEDIITELSRFREFFVIARNTSFSYKGKSFKISDVCRDLAVRYVLEGSVRKAGNRIRVTGQLIDGQTDNHVWADRFDGTVEDIFEFQDEITRAIVNAVAPQLLNDEIARSYGKDKNDLDAWDRVMQARWHIGHYTREHIDEAKILLTEAIATNPRLVQAYAELGVCHVMASLYGWSEDRAHEIQSALKAARAGVQLDSSDYAVQSVLGIAGIFATQFDDGLAHLRRGVQLNPNSATATGYLSMGEAICGNHDACVKALDRAVQLSPHDPMRGWWYAGRGISAFINELYDEVLDVTAECIRDTPDVPSAHRQRAATYAILDRPEDATKALNNLLRLLPGNTITQVASAVPFKSAEAHERWLNALRKAGMPE
jgi:TolB-like protein/Flp pilus assembly protein TadD